MTQVTDPPGRWTRARQVARAVGFVLLMIYGVLALAFFAWLLWEVGIGPA